MKAYSIIPARSGSKGVPGKNIKLLGGYPLIAYSIAASRMSRAIHRTIVSTDSSEIAEISKRYLAEVPFLRPKELASDKSADIDFVLHAINWFEINEKEMPQYLVHLRPTTPFRDPGIIDSAVNLFIDNQEASSLRSAHQASESPFKWYTKDNDGYFRPMSKEYSVDITNNPRQDFPAVYIPDGYADVYKVDSIRQSRRLLGDNLLAFESPACTEVDSPEDFDYLEFQLQKNSNVVFEYLKNNFPREG